MKIEQGIEQKKSCGPFVETNSQMGGLQKLDTVYGHPVVFLMHFDLRTF